MPHSSSFRLPTEDTLRTLLHNEIHTRPSANVNLPALVFYVAVLNANVSVQDELEHLRLLSGQDNLNLEKLKTNFFQIQTNAFNLIWERHTEFTRYTLIQNLPSTVIWAENFLINLQLWH
jgi:uncharacterized membrane-anchored protein